MESSIIGSFRKFYDDVINIINLFEAAGISVLSPKKSSIVDPHQEFVLLRSDNNKYSSIEIQLIALHRILKSNFVYVWNPDGYIGRTTAYEIGRVVEKKIPLYFSSHPKDLPIFLPRESVIDPKDFILYYRKKKTIPKFSRTIDTVFAQQLHDDLLDGKFYE